MPAGTKGLDEGHDPHLLDVSELIDEAWDSLTVRTIARCWIKADILPRFMHHELIFEHGKPTESLKRECYRREVEEISRLLEKMKMAYVEPSTIDENGDGYVMGLEEIVDWIDIEDNEVVQSAIVNDDMHDYLNSQVVGNELVNAPKVSEVDDEVVMQPVSSNSPTMIEVAERFKDVEKFVLSCGVEEASSKLRLAKRALMRAVQKREARKTRQSVVN